jgi:hypothetical protein
MVKKSAAKASKDRAAKKAKASPASKKIKPKAKPAAKAKPAPRPNNSSFQATFDGLKKILSSFAAEFRVTKDTPEKYELVTKSNSWRGGPMFFSAVIIGKAYVSYHLMPLYVTPELVKIVPPALKKRMTGKACFNFRTPDDAIFAELRELTQAAMESYRTNGQL